MRVRLAEYKTGRVLDATWKPFDTKTIPRVSYLIGALPRTGSNLITRQLTRAAVGMPAEYFQPFIADKFISTVGLSDFNNPEYIRHLMRFRQTPDGIFGIKSHWQQFEAMSDKAVGELPRSTKYIFMRRRDIAKQAISLERALSTGKWDPRWEPHLETQNNRADPENLERLLIQCKFLADEERSWVGYFRDRKIQPLEIYYEDLMEAPDDILKGILRHLDIDAEIPEKEPAPTGKTGEIGSDQDVLKELRLALAKEPVDRPCVK